MCGIVGYIGARPVRDVLLDGLTKLEYRGYDSAAFCALRRRIQAVRAVGNLGALKEKLDAAHGRRGRRRAPRETGIGHTRWATHGRVSEENAHPHFDGEDRVHVVVNGIVENYIELEDELVAAAASSPRETDAEVIAHLIAREQPATWGRRARRIPASSGPLRVRRDECRRPRPARRCTPECPLVVGLATASSSSPRRSRRSCATRGHVLHIENGEIVVLRRRV